MTRETVLKLLNKEVMEAEVRDHLTRSIEERAEQVRLRKLAAEQGDLSENTEYSTAEASINLIDNTIMSLQNSMKDLNRVDEIVNYVPTGEVKVGSIITLIDDKGVEYTKCIVPTVYDNQKENLISEDSPVAYTLMGKTAPTTITCRAPRGFIEYTLKEVI